MKSSMKTHRNPWSISIRVFCHLAMIFVTFPGPTSLQKDTGFGKAPLQRQEPGWNWLGPGSWRRGFVFFASVSGVFCYGGQGWCFLRRLRAGVFCVSSSVFFATAPGVYCTAWQPVFFATVVFSALVSGVFCHGNRGILRQLEGGLNANTTGCPPLVVTKLRDIS